MQRLGFIHDMMDVKVLILFVAARSGYPMTCQEIYETVRDFSCGVFFDEEEGKCIFSGKPSHRRVLFARSY